MYSAALSADGRLAACGGFDGTVKLWDPQSGACLRTVQPERRQRQRCGLCGRRGPLYDQGQARRRWRGLDLGSTRFFVEAAAPRVTCQVHGVVVARVPWARHRSRYLRAFEDQVAEMN